MKNLYRAVTSAFAYFSIVPAGRNVDAPTSLAIDALPLAGIVIGALAGAAGYGLALVSTPLIGYAAAFIATIVLSGAIHLDGFLDTCDALFASVEPQRRLEILKDPRHGTYAVAGMAILTVAWIATLSGFAPQQLPLTLAYAALLARVAAVMPMFFLPYAGVAVSSTLARRPSLYAFLFWLALATAGSFLFHRAWITVPVVLGLTYASARWVGPRFGGGLTGDAYGFLIVLSEIGTLLLLDIRV